VNLKPREKRILIGGGAVALVVGLYCWALEPLHQWSSEADAELALSEAQLEMAQLKAMRRASLAARVRRLRHQLGMSDEPAGPFIESLEKKCKECGVEITRLEQLAGAKKQDPGQSRSNALRVRAECDLGALTKLLFWLHYEAGPAVVDRLMISAHGKRKGAVAAEVDVRTYEVAAKPAKKEAAKDG